MGPGCAFLNYDNDGWMDIFLDNHGPSDFYTPAKPLRNDRCYRKSRSRFRQLRHGRRRRRCGWQDLFLANVDQEMFSLYKKNHNETFTNAAHQNQVAQATRLLSGWGLKFFDYDNDGNIDLFVANGHPTI